MKSSALVLFSGGQDSTVCLAWALNRFNKVETIGFDYGQRHRIELQCRLEVIEQFRGTFPQWSSRLGEDRLIDLGWMGQISDCALTRDTAIAMNDNGLPNTFVPGRNLIFLLTASAVAYRRGLQTLVAGMCETDYSGYPDCQDDTLKALQVATNLGMGTRFRFATPLMWIDKADTYAMAMQLGGLQGGPQGGQQLIDIINEYTHTCYLGDRSRRYDWGYGCDQCPACELRSQGWQKFMAHLTAEKTVI